MNTTLWTVFPLVMCPQFHIAWFWYFCIDSTLRLHHQRWWHLVFQLKAVSFRQQGANVAPKRFVFSFKTLSFSTCLHVRTAESTFARFGEADTRKLPHRSIRRSANPRSLAPSYLGHLYTLSAAVSRLPWLAARRAEANALSVQRLNCAVSSCQTVSDLLLRLMLELDLDNTLYIASLAQCRAQSQCLCTDVGRRLFQESY